MISTAVQKGSTVYVYSMTNSVLYTQQGTLMGFTSNTVSIKQGNTIYVYDARGHIMTTHYVN